MIDVDELHDEIYHYLHDEVFRVYAATHHPLLDRAANELTAIVTRHV